MEKALEGSKTLKFTLNDGSDTDGGVWILPEEFCRHLMIGIGRNASLSEVDLNFDPVNWHCPGDGRVVYVSHMLCDSVGCSV